MATREGLAALPAEVADLLDEIGAAPRLVAHLILVHDVATQLTASIVARVGDPGCDLDAVHFGAATHDIGKALEPSELSAPGTHHERLGRDWLANRVAESRARFAATHGMPVDAAELTVEDLLVIVADKIWKAKRDQQLEERLARELSRTTGTDFWSVHLALNDVLEDISNAATDRLNWQNQFPDH